VCRRGCFSFDSGKQDKMILQYREKILLAVLSGLLLTASFPPTYLSRIAWFAFIPLFKSLEGLSKKQAFTSGFVFGLAHNLTLVYWVVFVMGHYGNLPMTTSLGILALFATYLALYPALFSVAFAALSVRFCSFGVAGLWVLLEFVRTNVLTGFPWCLVGYSQYRDLPVIQIADLVGVYGVSFLILLTNALLYRLLFQRPLRAVRMEFAVTLMLVALTFAYGFHRLSETPHPSLSLKVTIVQGNIDQSIKWNPAYQAETIRVYRSLSLSSKPFAPELVVWPETAVPIFFQDEEELALEIRQTARQLAAYFIFGSPAYGRYGDSIHYLNRAYLLSPEGEVIDAYDKVHLVPFGEYVPLKRYLPFVRRLVVSAGDFKPGEKVAPLPLSKAGAGVLICYESIFPEPARTMTRNGADLLVNLTNDAWYGMTSAPYQHFSMAVFRAVENRRPLARAANTGFSAFIDARGEITQTTELFSEAVINQELALEQPRLTVYARFGDWFIPVLLIVTLIHGSSVLYYENKTRGGTDAWNRKS
jgi:apolipoprotein N-acyltransferase